MGAPLSFRWLGLRAGAAAAPAAELALDFPAGEGAGRASGQAWAVCVCISHTSFPFRGAGRRPAPPSPPPPPSSPPPRPHSGAAHAGRRGPGHGMAWHGRAMAAGHQTRATPPAHPVQTLSAARVSAHWAKHGFDCSALAIVDSMQHGQREHWRGQDDSAGKAAENASVGEVSCRAGVRSREGQDRAFAAQMPVVIALPWRGGMDACGLDTADRWAFFTKSFCPVRLLFGDFSGAGPSAGLGASHNRVWHTSTRIPFQPLQAAQCVPGLRNPLYASS